MADAHYESLGEWFECLGILLGGKKSKKQVYDDVDEGFRAASEG